MNKVILYTMPNCGQCEAQKNFLKEVNIEYEERDLLDEVDFIDKNNIRKAPVLVIDNNIYKEILPPFKLKELIK